MILPPFRSGNSNKQKDCTRFSYNGIKQTSVRIFCKGLIPPTGCVWRFEVHRVNSGARLANLKAPPHSAAVNLRKICLLIFMHLWKLPGFHVKPYFLHGRRHVQSHNIKVSKKPTSTLRATLVKAKFSIPRDTKANFCSKDVIPNMMESAFAKCPTSQPYTAWTPATSSHLMKGKPKARLADYPSHPFPFTQM